MKRLAILLTFTSLTLSILSSPVRSRMGSLEDEYTEENEPIPLPEGLVAVEYLESTGEEWIATGFNISETDDIDIEYRNVTALDTTGRHLQGWRSIGASYWGSNNGYYDRLGNSPRIPCGEGDVIRIIRNGTPGSEDIGTVNGEVNWQSTIYSKCSGQLIFFALNSSGAYRGAWRMGEIILRCNGEEAAHYIPVRVVTEGEEDEGAYYDMISGELLFNNFRSTGDFLIGPDL